ncbi:hypothetical protein QWT36_23885, partial [Salmonella enterica subsp. enterica serovar Typhi]|nr:hypothetical protein [Salmonella enterica subsp. enterica serovar Typhi]
NIDPIIELIRRARRAERKRRLISRPWVSGQRWLAIALANIDPIIELIRRARRAERKRRLISRPWVSGQRWL